MEDLSGVRIESRTIVEALRANARRIPDAPALRQHGPAGAGDGWEVITVIPGHRVLRPCTKDEHQLPC